MQDLLDAFIVYCRTTKGLSERTLEGYTDCGRLFLKWFNTTNGRAAALSDWTEDVALAYVAHEKVRGVRQSTRQQRVASLRSWGNWLVAKRHAARNPWLGIKTPVNEDLRQPCASADVVRRLLDAADRMPNRARGTMAKAMVAMLSMAGLRLFEMLALHVSDAHLDCEDPHIVIRKGKGRKVGVQPLPKLACQILSVWLSVRPQTQVPHLFMLRGAAKLPDRPFTKDAFYRLLPTLKSLAKLRDEDITAHSLRRFGGTAIAQQKGASVADAQKFLRQSSPQTTLRYIKPTSPLRGFVEAILPTEPAAEPVRDVRPTASRRRAIFRTH